jgi:Ulp1 family protease
MKLALDVIRSLSNMLGKAFDTSDWRAIKFEGPRETDTNINDCGVFICMMTFALCTGKDMKRSFRAIEMETIRSRLALILSSQEVLHFMLSALFSIQLTEY